MAVAEGQATGVAEALAMDAVWEQAMVRDAGGGKIALNLLCE